MDTDSGPHFPFHVFPANAPSASAFASASTGTSQNPRRKRSKLIKISDHLIAPSSSGGITKRKYGKKPDPSAPNITRPCSECGKKFWSWKALFGHMRCHPERQWRGINPPPDFRRSTRPPTELETTEEDDEIAASLIMLANGPNAMDETETVTDTNCREVQESEAAARGRYMECSGPSSYRFECSSCKKVFGSHQALEGHRASHKNVKGCLAITRTESEFVDENVGMGGLGRGHECSICMKVFSSGQALGGHKRCHWGKEDGYLDLNLPPPLEDIQDSSSSYSSGLILDLRLGLN